MPDYDQLRAYEGDKPYVFISYAHDDFEIVAPFIAEMQKTYNVWFDKGLKNGIEYDKQIAAKINRCSVFIYAITALSLESDYCQSELHMARERYVESQKKIRAGQEPKKFSFINVIMRDRLEYPEWFGLYRKYQMFPYYKYPDAKTAVYELFRNSLVSDEVRKELPTEQPSSDPIGASGADNGSLADKRSGKSVQAPQASASGDGSSNKARESVVAKQPKYNVGEYISFGSYKQGRSGEKKAVEWLILERKGNKALLISRYILDLREFNPEYAAVTWNTCSLCGWLNREFLNSAFGTEEKNMILKTKADNKVSVLSKQEAEKYFESNDARTCKPTEYVYAKEENERLNTIWWLRSPGFVDNFAAVVESSGYVLDAGYFVGLKFGVRPVLWINLKYFESLKASDA